MTFLLILIGLIILAPYIGRGLMWLLGFAARRHIEKQTRRMEDSFARAAGLDPEEERRKRREQERVREQGGWTSPTPKKKKIDSADAEYIKFKDLDQPSDTSAESAADSTADSQTSFSVEEQIVDITWVDVETSSEQ